jgi:hypothetical protein
MQKSKLEASSGTAFLQNKGNNVYFHLDSSYLKDQ